MRFVLFPDTIRKIVSAKESAVVRQLSFEGPLETTIATRTLDGGCFLKDGRALKSIPCTTSVTELDTPETTGTLTFIPAFSIDELRISHPDSLAVEVVLPKAAFSELWSLVENGGNLALGGEASGISSKYPHSLTRQPYEWDVSIDENQEKPVLAFGWSIVLPHLTWDPETKKLLLSAGDDPPQKYFDELLKAVEAKYRRWSQMQRRSIAALQQVRMHAEQKGCYGEAAERLFSDAIELIESAQTAMREGKIEGDQADGLWEHNFLDWEGSYDWAPDPERLAGIAARLIRCHWLRIDELEWAIVDALMYREMFAIGRWIKTNFVEIPEHWAYSETKVNLVGWGLATAGLLLTAWYVNEHQYTPINQLAITGGVGIVLALVFVTLPAKCLRRYLRRYQKAVEAWRSMRDAYLTTRHNHLARGATLLSPAQIRAALLAAQAKGAVWDTAIFGLIDRAANRDPPVWVLES